MNVRIILISLLVIFAINNYKCDPLILEMMKSLIFQSGLKCSINIIVDKSSPDSTDLLSNSIFGNTQSLENKGNQLLKQYHTFTVEARKASIYNSTIKFKLSERILRNRWRNSKWKFCNSFFVLSENFEFIFRALKVVGPNVTEYSNIFIILTQEAYNNQNGRFKFQRDIMFGKLYSPLVVITHERIIRGPPLIQQALLHNHSFMVITYFTAEEESIIKVKNKPVPLRQSTSSVRLQLVCPLCSNSLSPPPLLYTSQDVTMGALNVLINIHSSIRQLNNDYNNINGYGSTALLCRIGFRSNILDTDYHSQVESKAYKTFDPKASKNGIILGILINLFNFTIKQETWIDGYEEGNYSGIYLSPGGDISTIHIFGRQLVISHNIQEFFLYCRKEAIIPSTSWDFLTSPFDPMIWLLITITSIAFILIHKGKVRYGLDIWWSVLGLPCTSDWRRSKFLSYFLVLLINLNIGYLSVITSKVIIPNREQDIQTPTELFKQGFRFISENASFLAPGFIAYFHQFLKKFSIDESDVLVNVDHCPRTHSPICISEWAGLATGLLYQSEKAEALLSIPAEMRERCHGVKIPFREYWVTFYSQGPLAVPIYKTQQFLITSGISVFWERLLSTSSVYHAYRTANHTDSAINKDPPKLSFETPIFVVFKTYAVLIAFCLIEFCCEIFLAFIVKFLKFRFNRVININTKHEVIVW